MELMTYYIDNAYVTLPDMIPGVRYQFLYHHDDPDARYIAEYIGRDDDKWYHRMLFRIIWRDADIHREQMSLFTNKITHIKLHGGDAAWN